MSEYWKSTPQYWCKFCKTYVRDTPLEKRNHEVSGKHQGNIQRSLRELHKGAEAAERDRKRARDEVARLNSLVGGKSDTTKDGKDAAKPLGTSSAGPANVASHLPPSMTAAEQRKAHAEQLLAMGVNLPDKVKSEVTGIGGWQTVSERVVHDDQMRSMPAQSLAQIKAEADKVKTGGGVDSAGEPANTNEEEDGSGARKRKLWGTTMKTYPGSSATADDDNDLGALLRGISGNKTVPSSNSKMDSEEPPKIEELDTVEDEVKREFTSNGEEKKALADIPPPVVFKKRKIKR